MHSSEGMQHQQCSQQSCLPHPSPLHVMQPARHCMVGFMLHCSNRCCCRAMAELSSQETLASARRDGRDLGLCQPTNARPRLPSVTERSQHAPETHLCTGTSLRCASLQRWTLCVVRGPRALYGDDRAHCEALECSVVAWNAVLAHVGRTEFAFPARALSCRDRLNATITDLEMRMQMRALAVVNSSAFELFQPSTAQTSPNAKRQEAWRRTQAAHRDQGRHWARWGSIVAVGGQGRSGGHQGRSQDVSCEKQRQSHSNTSTCCP